jgi:hypothetical protein
VSSGRGRRRRRSATAWRRTIELDGRRFAVRGIGHREVLPLLRAGQLRHQHGRELPDVGVVLLHRAIVVLSRDGDPVLRSRQLVLEAQESLIGLERRVRLGDRDQPAERAGELGVGVGHLLRIVSLHRAEHARTRLGHLREHRLLVLGVALHRLDEVRDQIGPALQLDLDLTLCRARLLIERLDRVVAAAREGDGKQQGQPATCHRNIP